MIDTVCLLIPKYEMSFVDQMSTWDLYSQTDQYAKYVRNPSKLERDTGKYFPRLTGYKRRFKENEANVRMEFSVPKLLFLNNLDEVTNEDFSQVISTLKERLQEMGVIITKDTLQNASVSSVHFSKNIPLKNGYTASYILSEMNKVNLNKIYDQAKTRYINSGESIYAHAISHQFVAYDKMADLDKSSKKAIDKDQTLYQKTLFTNLQYALDHEILRFEIRLSHKQKMNKELESLGYTKNPTFKDVFGTELSKKIVTEYWNKIIKRKNEIVLSPTLTPMDVLQAILLNNQSIKPKQALYLTGLYTLARNEEGLGRLRSVLDKRAHKQNWYKTHADLRETNDLVAKDNLRSWVKEIDKSLETFIPYRINNQLEM